MASTLFQEKHSEEVFILALNTHSIYLGAIRMALSGHRAAAFPLFRTAIESAAYCLVIARNPEAAELWKKRHEDKESNKKHITYFANVMSTKFKDIIIEDDPSYERMIFSSYEASLDFGAHPNPRAVENDLIRNEAGEIVNYIAVHDTLGPNSALLHSQLSCLNYGTVISIILQLVIFSKTPKPYPSLNEIFYPQMCVNNKLFDDRSGEQFDPTKRYYTRYPVG